VVVIFSRPSISLLEVLFLCLIIARNLSKNLAGIDGQSLYGLVHPAACYSLDIGAYAEMGKLVMYFMPSDTSETEE